MKPDAEIIRNNNAFRINEAALEGLTFDEADTVSLLFLLHGNQANSLEKVQTYFKQSKEDPNFWLQHFRKFKKKWENWLLEALILIQNIETLQQQFGYKNSEINQFRNFRRVPTQYVIETLRNLYLMCEHMNNQSTKELLKKMYGSEKPPDFEFLELHVLNWMKMNFIQIFDNQKIENVTKLLKVLKSMDLDRTRFYLNLSALKYEETLKYDNTGQKGSPTEINDHQNGYAKPEEEEATKWRLLVDSKSDNLCIIMNMQKFFVGEERVGSQKDVDNLIYTFRGCSYDIVKPFNNLTSVQFRKIMNEIPQHCRNRYKQLMLFILSHGIKGKVIFFEDETISYEEISKMFYKPELKNISRALVFQCCRGNLIGINGTNRLAIEGLPFEDINKYKSCVVWHSTLDDFVSHRHPEEGTLFIQELCDVLQNETEDRSIHNIYQKVNQKLEERKGLQRQSTEIQFSGMTDNYEFPSFSRLFLSLDDFEDADQL